MAARKRRIRSPHPGVKLNARKLPSGRTQWRARFVDADTGRQTDATLDPIALPTAEARRLWAVRKSQAIAKRAMALSAGAQPRNDTPIPNAVESYLGARAERLRPATLSAYRIAAGVLAGWATTTGVETMADISPASLAAFREYLGARRLRQSAPGGSRGSRREAARPMLPNSVNMHLRAVKTMLDYWRTHGLTPQLTSDAISDSLKALPVTHERPEHLTPAQLDKLLHAALRHDATVFAATREEHAGLRPLGSTRRYEPIAPFAAFLLLTGCRRGEALGLKWSDVDLDALDHEGRKVGEIRLRGEHTKTHRARTIGLEVSPALRAMLAAMKLRAGSDADGLRVFGGARPYTVDLVEASRQRLVGEYGSPAFTWQALRSTCATFLTNAPGIFGAATAYMSARQLGHSVTVAERHYTGLVRGIPKDAHTLESAMQVEATMREVLATGPSAAVLDQGARHALLPPLASSASVRHTRTLAET